jgi:hypothetical protein
MASYQVDSLGVNCTESQRFNASRFGPCDVEQNLARHVENGRDEVGLDETAEGSNSDVVE